MRALALLGCLSIAATSVACGTTGEDGSPAHQGPAAQEHDDSASTKLRVAVTPHCSSAPVFAAHSNGAFDKEGIDAKFVKFSDGKEALAALRRGEVDLAFAGDIPIAEASMKHQDLRVLATVAHSTYEDWLVAKVGIATPADLRGKTIGVPRHSGARYVLHTVLYHARLGGDRAVHVKFMGFEKMKGALESGEIDAFVVQQPLRRAVQSVYGSGFTTIPDPGGYHVSVNLVTTDGMSTKHPEALKSFLRALGSGVEAAAADAKPIAEAIEKEIGKIDPNDDPIWTECSRAKFAMTLDGTLAKTFAQEGAWLKANEEHDHTLDLGKLVEPSLLAAVRPEVVTFKLTAPAAEEPAAQEQPEQ